MRISDWSSDVCSSDLDIITDGVVNDAELQAAKDFILDADDDPTEVAKDDTNYEAGLRAALDWFSDPGNTLDNPDFNQTVFISDGVPNRAYQGDGTSAVTGLTPTAQAALDHALGQVVGADQIGRAHVRPPVTTAHIVC